ncbi:hypothetical protein FQN54_008650 [Arachnomyces sp. PD_36]|nr:hypothetical protein FQN54_008650 [Arachnomyces sp. PD_36]
MEVSVISLQDFVNATSTLQHLSDFNETVDYFTSENVEKCLLNCRRQSKTRLFKKKKLPGAVSNTDYFALSDVTASAVNGCRGCKFLATLIKGVFSVYTSELDLEGVALKWVTSSFALEVAEKCGRIRRIQLFHITGAKTRVSGMPESNFLAGNTALPLSFDRARVFLQTCENEHTECESGRGVALPKRLLNVKEIFSPNGDAKVGIRLEKTEHRKGTYTCLSHCWGDASEIHTQTREANINDYCRFIPWSDLPNTFRDAVILTRRLGVEHLWIDSLCIIQDSRLDWEVESIKMGEIYSNSYVTIAASASHQSSDGCFSKSIPDSFLLIRETSRPDVYVGVRDCQRAGKITLERDREESLHENFPLFTRAWAYQERMLSRRILFCNKSEFQVGCQAGLQCECGKMSMAPHLTPAPRGLNVTKLKGLANLQPDTGGGGLGDHEVVPLVYRKWLEVVAGYATLSITKPSDRLPALSATARIISRNMGSDYLAGIWRASLMEGLLWFVKGRPSRPRPVAKGWRAPSWSWASLDAPEGLEFMLPGAQFSTSFQGKIEHAECVLAGGNELGEVKSGFIRLKASLGSTFWSTRCSGCSTPTGRRGGREKQLYNCTLYTTPPDEPQNLPWKRCAFSQPALDLLGGQLGFHADCEVDNSKYGFSRCIGKGSCRIAPCYLLYVHRISRTQKKFVDDEKRPLSDTFLVLTKVQSQEDTYERIALAMIGHKTEATRNRWFREVWPSIVLPETSITLV